MITDIEYPATHSMSTSWYMVDDDDNVGIMQFDDNGPVPYGLVEDYNFANNAVLGELLEINQRCGDIHLTPEQIDELLGKPHAPQEEKRWYDVVVKVNPDDVERFLSMVEVSDIDMEGCVSEALGLYKINASECIADYEGTVGKGTLLEFLINQGIIQAVYSLPELEMGCRWDKASDELAFTKEFDSAPYYIYLQPYWPDFLQKRMCTPRHPVKFSQVEARVRHKLLRIPGRFSQMEYMQIARWHACKLTGVGEYRYVGDNLYSLLPMPDGVQRYVLSDLWNFDFFLDCPLDIKRLNECVKCDFLRCATTYSQVNTMEPTVLFVTDPRTMDSDWSEERLNGVKERMAAFSYVPMYPKANPSSHIVMREDVVGEMTDEVLLSLLRESHNWLDHVVSQLRPRVIVLMDRAKDVFEQVYHISGHKVCIAKSVYPIYLTSEVKAHWPDIERLASMPFQGHRPIISYSKEKMKEMIQKGEAR